jgi:hypothetical protein
MKFRVIGSAVLAISVLSGSAMAGPAMVHQPGESIYCATREPGNPHSRLCDYIMWSKWRERGGWDSTLDNACIHNPAFVPGECGLDPRSRQSIAW